MGHAPDGVSHRFAGGQSPVACQPPGCNKKINACAFRCTEDTKGQAQPMAMPKRSSLNMKEKKTKPRNRLHGLSG
jgi:hypothetical protein